MYVHMPALGAICKCTVLQLSMLCIVQRDALIGTIIGLSAIAAFFAGWQRHQGPGGLLIRANATSPQNIALTLLRVVSSLVAFTALALFATPGLTCIFRDYSRAGIQTKIPDWMQRYVLGVTAVGLSTLAAAVPGLVT